MESRVSSSFSDLLHKVVGSCLVHTIVPTLEDPEEKSESYPEERESMYYEYEEEEGDAHQQEEEDGEVPDRDRMMKIGKVDPKIQQMEVLIMEVFEAVSVMKRAYASLRNPHSPWDPEKMRLADAAVVGEFRHLGRLRERFRWGSLMPSSIDRRTVYACDPEVELLKKEVKEAQVENLRERLGQASGRKRCNHRSSTRFYKGRTHLSSVFLP